MMRSLSIFLYLFFFAVSSHAQENLPFAKGETINYTIKKFAFKGESTLTFQGKQNLNGRDVYLIVFKANGFNFYDEENIYVDTKTFRPVLVIRDINIRFLRKKEKITEEYLPAQGKIKITKIADGQTTVQTIEKKGPIDNIYGAIYRYRQSGTFKLGDTMDLRLPTMDVKLKLLKVDSVISGGKRYAAFYMESIPAKYMVWFDTGPQRVPLRITDTAGIGNMNMVIRNYKERE